MAATSSGPDSQRRGGLPAGEQPVHRFHLVHGGAGQLGGMAGAQQGGASGQQAGDDVDAQAGAPGGAGFERPLVGGVGEAHAQDGEPGERCKIGGVHRVAGEDGAQAERQAAGLTGGRRHAGKAQAHHRAGGAPALLGLRPGEGLGGLLCVLHVECWFNE